jgi:hypothetical protein
MENRISGQSRSWVWIVWVFSSLLVAFLSLPSAYAQAPAAGQRTPPAVGTIKSLTQNSLVVTTDSGSDVKLQLTADVKLLRVPPGSKDLKEATPIQLSDLQPGDRVLVRTKASDDGSALVATTVIAMKKADIAEKQSKEREEWQRHGIGGLVKSVDATAGTITLDTLTATGPKDVVIHVGKNMVLRRYAPGSVKFDDAKTAPITEIHPGDQLRARGQRSADGAEFTADEIVSGSFRNIAGTIDAVDASTSTMTVTDLATKKPVEIKVTPDSQMRKLPAPMAQRIAARLRGDAAAAGSGNGAPASTAAAQPPAGNAAAGGAQAGAGASANGGPAAGPGRNGGGDMQQMLSRLPASPLTDFQKGDVVMIVATSEQADGRLTVITLLGGVEPILQSSTQGQAASILSPWSLNQGGGGDTP